MCDAVFKSLSHAPCCDKLILGGVIFLNILPLCGTFFLKFSVVFMSLIHRINGCVFKSIVFM